MPVQRKNWNLRVDHGSTSYTASYLTVHHYVLRMFHINIPFSDDQSFASNSKIVQPTQCFRTSHCPRDDKFDGSVWLPMVDTLNKYLWAMVDDQHNQIWYDNLYLQVRQIFLDQHRTLIYECTRGTINVWFSVLLGKSRPTVRLENNERSNHLSCVDIWFREEI